jgi:hypothetical protein
MASVVGIYKCTGISGAETPVTSIGLKRIDSVVAGSADGDVDDTGDVKYYQVYTPEIEDVKSCSYETWFRFYIKEAPSNQLSNIRLYVEGTKPDIVNLPDIRIGRATTYTRPTNAVSSVALNDIYDYTSENPLPITVNGLSGYSGTFDTAYTSPYAITVEDIGKGNVFYVNGVHQEEVNLFKGSVSENPITYRFNSTHVEIGSEAYSFRLYGPSGILGTTEGVTVYNDGASDEYILVDATTLFAQVGTLSITYADQGGHLDIDGAPIGAVVNLIDSTYIDPRAHVDHVLGVRTAPLDSTEYQFTIDGAYQKQIELNSRSTYTFTNPQGATYPFRIFTGMKSEESSSIIVKGVLVENGGTNDEIVHIDTTELYAINGGDMMHYGTTTDGCNNNVMGGNIIFNPAIVLNDACDSIPSQQGEYNLMTVGDKSDFVILQIQCDINTLPDDYFPRIVVEYDEC